MWDMANDNAQRLNSIAEKALAAAEKATEEGNFLSAHHALGVVQQAQQAARGCGWTKGSAAPVLVPAG